MTREGTSGLAGGNEGSGQKKVKSLFNSGRVRKGD